MVEFWKIIADADEIRVGEMRSLRDGQWSDAAQSIGQQNYEKSRSAWWILIEQWQPFFFETSGTGRTEIRMNLHLKLKFKLFIDLAFQGQIAALFYYEFCWNGYHSIALEELYKIVVRSVLIGRSVWPQIHENWRRECAPSSGTFAHFVNLRLNGYSDRIELN